MTSNVEGCGVSQHVPSVVDQTNDSLVQFTTMRGHGSGRHCKDINVVQCPVICCLEHRALILRLCVHAAMIMLMEIGTEHQGQFKLWGKIISLYTADSDRQ